MATVLTMAVFGIVVAPATALAGRDEDASIIKASSDDIYRVQVLKVYDPEGKTGEVKVTVENVLRGDSGKTGRQINLVWDTAYPKKTENWVVMVGAGQDGALHVHPRIRYDISQEGVAGDTTESWIFELLR